MNNTKWEELRSAMLGLGAKRPQWRTRTVQSGHVSQWDGDWFYHFSSGGYEDVEWLEIKVTSAEQKNEVLAALRRIHVPGHETENGFKVYGYAASTKNLEYV